MPRIPMPAFAAAFVLALLLPAAPAGAAAPDGNVEWAGISHIAWQDRRPLCPVSRRGVPGALPGVANDLTARAGVRGRGRGDQRRGWTPRARPCAARTTSGRRSCRPRRRRHAELLVRSSPTARLTDYVSVSGLTATVPADGGFALDFATLVARAARRDARDRRRRGVPGVGAARRRLRRARRVQRLGHGEPAREGRRVLRRARRRRRGRASSTSTTSTTSPGTPTRARASLDPANSYNAHREPVPLRLDRLGVRDARSDSLVIYQLHVGTFAGRNDPMGVSELPVALRRRGRARRAPASSLGVNAVMFNPITEFPTDASAGYNPITACGRRSRGYGTPDDFKYAGGRAATRTASRCCSTSCGTTCRPPTTSCGTTTARRSTSRRPTSTRRGARRPPSAAARSQDYYAQQRA